VGLNLQDFWKLEDHTATNSFDRANNELLELVELNPKLLYSPGMDALAPFGTEEGEGTWSTAAPGRTRPGSGRNSFPGA
jgi:hypothetical protein